MTSFNSEHFSFFTFDPLNFRQLDFVKELTKDPLIASQLLLLEENLYYTNSDDLLSNAYLVGMDDNIVGYLSLYNYTNHVGMDYAVHSDFRGIRNNSNETIGCQILKESSEFIFREYKKIEFLKLLISNRNIRSIKAALRAGFTSPEKGYDVTEYYKYNKHF